MATAEERLQALEDHVKRLRGQISGSLVVGGALQQTPGDATLSLPHNDSWIFEDNVDGTHPANLRYVIASTVRQIVSARLSIKMAPYRTYNNFSATTTQGASVTHTHPHSATHAHSHGHTIPFDAGPFSNAVGWDGGNMKVGGGGTSAGINTNATTAAPGISDANTQDHTHLISITSTLGVTEGATATGVTVAFDGVDHTADLGGPFNADVIELDVRRFLATTTGLWHVIAMQPSGLGRIEAHLRLGVYVAAGQGS